MCMKVQMINDESHFLSLNSLNQLGKNFKDNLTT